MTAASAAGFNASARRPSTPTATAASAVGYGPIVEEVDDSDDETGLKAYGGAGPNGYNLANRAFRPNGSGPRYGYVSRSAGSASASGYF